MEKKKAKHARTEKEKSFPDNFVDTGAFRLSSFRVSRCWRIGEGGEPLNVFFTYTSPACGQFSSLDKELKK